MNRTCILTLLLTALFAFAAPAPVSAATSQLYRITDLGSIGGVGSSEALAVNDLGHVTGRSNSTPFYWTPQLGMVDLGIPATHNAAAGVAINNNDQIAVSTSKGQAGSYEGHAFRWTNGVYQDLGTLGGSYSTAYGIDDLGRVTGYAYTTSQSAVHAYRSTTGATLVDIDGVGGLGGDYSLGYAMNSSGHVVGKAYGSDSKYHAFFWPGSGPMQDLGLFGGAHQAQADDISDNGIIMGIGSGPFIWQAGVTTMIGSPGFQNVRGTAVNNAGQVVGQYVDSQGFSMPMIWDAIDGAIDLNDLLDPATSGDWVVVFAHDLNNAGQIVGQGFHNGNVRAFLMTPIPEPSAFLLLAYGTAVIIAKWRCHQLRHESSR